MSYFTFHVKEVKKDRAVGAIVELNKEPLRLDYFVETGEVEFGGRYEHTGYFNDNAFAYAEKLWHYQCYPIGKYKEKSVTIPKGVKLKPGQYIKVVGDVNSDVLEFMKDRVGENVVIKKYKETI
jgi:hypothetical protein